MFHEVLYCFELTCKGNNLVQSLNKLNQPNYKPDKTPCNFYKLWTHVKEDIFFFCFKYLKIPCI